MLYPFKCKQCDVTVEIFAYMDEISDIQHGQNGREKPKCEICSTEMVRIYNTLHIKKFHGKITPLEVRDSSGKVHKVSQNLWRN